MASADSNGNSNNNNDDMNGLRDAVDDTGICNGHKDGRTNCHNNGTDCHLRSQNTAF